MNDCVHLSKAPLSKGGCHADSVTGGFSVIGTKNPSVCPPGSHLPLDKGGFSWYA